MRLLIGIVTAFAALAQTPLTVEAKHDHWRGWCAGRLAVDEQGLSFESARKKDHHWRWGYLDIQQIRILDNGEVSLLTYKDNKWRLGADREFHFQVADKQFATQAAPLLGARLEHRFVSGLASAPVQELWELPVKHLLRFSGSEGRLMVASDRIVYQTDRPGDSRTWYWYDIDHISRAGPYQVTITTFERARSHYGNLKDHNFQLKQPLSEERYDVLWRRLEQSKGLQVLTSTGDGKHAP